MSYDDLRHADRITIDGLEVFANHGVYPEENALGQKFIVSLVLYADLRAAGEHDNLDASIDYGSVCHDVDGYLREHTFKLIEAAARVWPRCCCVVTPCCLACVLSSISLGRRRSSPGKLRRRDRARALTGSNTSLWVAA